MASTLPRIYLGSQSPRRQELLKQAAIPFEMLLPDPEEDVEALEIKLPNDTPSLYIQRVTQLKIEAAIQRLKKRQLIPLPILCADTIVALDNHIFGKPADAKTAQEMLESLSNSAHQVLTAIGLAYPDGQYHAALSISIVKFRTLTTEEIKQYIASGEPFGKAGGYAIQGLAAEFIEHITGSYSGIMGLPLFETMTLLRQFSK